MIYVAFNNMLYYYFLFCVGNVLEYQYRNNHIINNPYYK